ncbi:MAG: FHA domain-containing protein [Gemmataceae bacterium]|nr:FHA domain-containing protein [Gemmataceae bacterium]
MTTATLPVLPNVTVYLMVADGPRQGSLVPVRGPQFLIGRNPRCHLRPSSASIADLHCAILARGGRLFVGDLNSEAGTYLNERQIVGEVELLDQDQLRVGPLRFVVCMPAGKTTAPPSAPGAWTAVEEEVPAQPEPTETEADLTTDEAQQILLEEPTESAPEEVAAQPVPPPEPGVLPEEAPAVVVSENPARVARALLRKYSARRR